ncbi:3-isopropylmalate dehydratase [Enterovirga aerilata]|uniref:3-isopropylmalate dehydratase n=1 Tax=Enterovirga aerilata TaxID=2730920 RepID=A0A849I6D1_9HYPH|nr:3-isopropylmalate dehydratase [Enterovirga sp. DB1703]NNM71597.1 3-isopropylmalate dehydratase [Enterovirga sp. DB1703]
MLTPYHGRCWKLPDGVSSDQLIAPPHVFNFEPDYLRQHLLAEVSPDLARSAKPGDIIVAGAHFAHGSVHSHPFIAMKAMGLGLICRSLSRGPYRLTVFMGVPVLTIDDETYCAIRDADELAVDFATGEIRTTDKTFKAEPLPPFLMEIIEAGGGFEYAKQQSARSSSHAGSG